MRTVLISLIALGLAGCGSGSEDTSASDLNLSWETAEDGSSYAQTSHAGGNNLASIRCWPDVGGGFTCITASEMKAAGALEVSRSSFVSLPSFLLPYASTSDGYGCRYLMGEVEEISRSGEPLISNADVPRWSRKYVKDFIDANDIKGTPWFDCLTILGAVRNGSLATLGTTQVTEKMMR